MKVKINNKELEKKISKFISTGNLSPLSKKADQIDMANVYVYDDCVEFFGTQSNKANNLKAYFIMEAEVIEEGSFMLPNVKSLENNLDFKGDEITLTIDESDNNNSGMTSLTIKDEISEADVSVSTKLGTSIDEDYKSLDNDDLDSIVFNNIEHKIVGSIRDWKYAVKAIKKNLKYVRTVKVDISSDKESQTYTFEAFNKNSKARYKIECEGMVDEEIDVTVRSIEPVFQNISSEVFIYFYKVQKIDNTYRFVFVDEDIFWFFVSTI